MQAIMSPSCGRDCLIVIPFLTKPDVTYLIFQPPRVFHLVIILKETKNKKTTATFISVFQSLKDHFIVLNNQTDD